MPLHASGLRGGESGLPWRGYSPEESGNHWRTPTKGVINAYIREHNLIKGWPDAFPTIQARLEALDNAGFIVWSANGVPRVKMHLAATKGVAATDLIIDVPMASGKERLGYPTQKPLDLLERIIKASSNDGSVVLDPFCGCATALIASEKLERQWVGIDLSHKAVELVHDRLEREVSIGPIYHSMVTARTDFPRRTDLDKPLNYRLNRHVLFGQQEGRCNGCKTEFPFRNMTVDHVIPQSRGGTDHLENLQLLCNYCNSLKGDRPQEYLLAELAKRLAV